LGLLEDVDKLAGEKGYTYRALDLKEIRNQLHTRFFANGDRLVFVPIIDSTNIRAMQLARMGAGEGTVVLTDSQTAGQGALRTALGRCLRV